MPSYSSTAIEVHWKESIMMRTMCAIGALLLAACGTQNVGKECPKESAVPVVDLEADNKYFTEKCSACHKLPDVKAHSDKEWEEVVQKMIVQKGAIISNDDQRQIVQYLQKSKGRD